ncbi:MAG: hypothetical protein ACRCZJ_01075 [Erysipelotrichaceae bacterium]
MKHNTIITYLDEKDWDLATLNDITYYRCNMDDIVCVFEGSFHHDAIVKFFMDYVSSKQEHIHDIIVITNTQDQRMFRAFQASVQQYAALREEQYHIEFHDINMRQVTLTQLWDQVEAIVHSTDCILLDFASKHVAMSYRYVLWQLQQHQIPVTLAIGVSLIQYQEEIISAQARYEALLPYQSMDWLKYFDALDHIVSLLPTFTRSEIQDQDALSQQLQTLHEQTTTVRKAAQTLDELLGSYMATHSLSQPQCNQLKPYREWLRSIQDDAPFAYNVYSWYLNHGFISEARTYYLASFATYLHPICFGSQSDHKQAKKHVLRLLEASYEPHIFIAFLKEISRSIDLGSKATLDPKYLIQRYSAYLETHGFASDKATSTIRKFNALRSYYLQLEVSLEHLKNRSHGAFEAIGIISELAETNPSLDINDWNQVYRNILLTDERGIMGTILEVQPRNNTILTTLSELERYTKLHQMTLQDNWDKQTLIPLLFDFYLCDSLEQGRAIKDLYQHNDARFEQLALDTAELFELSNSESPLESAFQSMSHRLREHFTEKPPTAPPIATIMEEVTLPKEKKSRFAFWKRSNRVERR